MFGCLNLLATGMAHVSPVDAMNFASLPDGATLMITNDLQYPVNNLDSNIYIKFWDEGNGLLSPDGYPFTCGGNSLTPDTTLLPGESIVLLREGAVIRAVEMDCLGVFGGPAVIGSPCDDGIASTSDDAYDENCVCVGLAPVPTLSQWGIIILGLSLGIIGLLVFSFRSKLIPKT